MRELAQVGRVNLADVIAAAYRSEPLAASGADVRSLAVALICGAVEDLALGSVRERANARAWIFGGDAEVKWATACELAGLNPEAAACALLGE